MTGVVFDFGNVLYRVDYPAMARRLAPDRAAELLRRFVASPLQIAYESGLIPLEAVLSGLAEQGFPFDRSRFLDAYLSIFSPVEGMAELLERLAESLPLGLLSNTSPEHARSVIERVPEYRLFRARVYSFEVGCMKPDPVIYREIARRLGLEPAGVAYVDDIAELALAAEAVGMQGIPFSNAGDLRKRLASTGVPDLAARGA